MGTGSGAGAGLTVVEVVAATVVVVVTTGRGVGGSSLPEVSAFATEYVANARHAPAKTKALKRLSIPALRPLCIRL